MSEQEPASTTPWRRDPAELAAGLTRWARTQRGPRAEVTDVRAPDSGMANETILFRLDGDPLVARLAPMAGTPYPVFPTFDLELQRRCMDLVRQRTSVPVPEAVHLEPSDEWLGVPFLVLRAVDGIVPSDNPPYVFTGWLLDASDAERRRLEERSIAVLVELHTITPDDEDLSFLAPAARGDTYLARQLAFQRQYYEWACEGTPVPLIEEAFQVLTDTMPAASRSAFSWGDSRIGNVLYRDAEPVALRRGGRRLDPGAVAGAPSRHRPGAEDPEGPRGGVHAGRPHPPRARAAARRRPPARAAGGARRARDGAGQPSPRAVHGSTPPPASSS